jgi:hypothetical protein
MLSNLFFFEITHTALAQLLIHVLFRCGSIVPYGEVVLLFDAEDSLVLCGLAIGQQASLERCITE